MISNKTLLGLTLVLCVLVQVSVQISDVLPQKVIEFMGSRKMRYHHFLWHNLRENWLLIDVTTQHAIAKLGWAPPRPSLTWSTNGTEVLLENNGAGQDFLYMHRQMFNQVNEMVADTDYERIVGWKHCPYPGDPKYKVPAAYTIPNEPGFTAAIANSKTDEYFWNVIKPTDDKLWDEDYMRTVDLGTYGSQIEYSIHRWLHFRFSEQDPVGLRNTVGGNPTPDIPANWDNLNYRWLIDSYSSHVNPIFWKIHGWVDAHIDAWVKANGLTVVPWADVWENGPQITVTDLFAAGAKTDEDKDGNGVNDSDEGDGDADVNSSDSSDEVDEHYENMHEVMKMMLRLGLDNAFRRNLTSSIVDNI